MNDLETLAAEGNEQALELKKKREHAKLTGVHLTRRITLAQFETSVARTANQSEGAIFNFALGLAGETGEAIEHIKKAGFHGKPLDLEALKLECGDVAFYLVALCQTVGLTLEEIMIANVEKLQKRYPEGFK